MTFSLALILASCSRDKPESRSIALDTSIDTTAGRIGDVFRYSIRVQGMTDQILDTLILFVPNGQIRQRIPTKEAGNRVGFEFEIAFWDTGTQIIPAIPVKVLNPDSSLNTVFETDPIEIKIISMVKPGEQPNLRPLKPPVAVAEKLSWIKIFRIGIMVLLLIGILWIWRKRHRPVPGKITPQIYVAPDARALSRLRNLNKNSHADVKQHYTALSHVLREYIENSFYIRALEMTTEEIAQNRVMFPLENALFKSWLDLLQRADLIKYAKVIPESSVVQADLDWSIRFIEETVPLWKKIDSVSVVAE